MLIFLDGHRRETDGQAQNRVGRSGGYVLKHDEVPL